MFKKTLSLRRELQLNKKGSSSLVVCLGLKHQIQYKLNQKIMRHKYCFKVLLIVKTAADLLTFMKIVLVFSNQPQELGLEIEYFQVRMLLNCLLILITAAI